MWERFVIKLTNIVSVAFILSCTVFGSLSPRASDELYNLFDKKWSVSGMDCNLNGGTYVVYSDSIDGGSYFFAAGKKMNTEQKQWFKFKVMKDKRIRYIRRIYAFGNPTMISMLGAPNALVTQQESTIYFIDQNKISIDQKIKQVDILNSTNGNIVYSIKRNRSLSSLCEE